MPWRVTVYVDVGNLGKAVEALKRKQEITDEWWDVDYPAMIDELDSFLADTVIDKCFFYDASKTGRLNTFHRRIIDWGYIPKVRRLKSSHGHARQKGVDIQLAVDMLSHAYEDKFDIAFLCSGDGDFVPLIDRVHDLGKEVHLAAFVDSLSGELQRRSDLPYLSLTRLGDKVIYKKVLV